MDKSNNTTIKTSRIIRSINIDKSIWELLDKISKEENRSKSNMIEKLIKDYNKK